MPLVDIYDKVIAIVELDATLKGTYFGDQIAYSDYPVACVGDPSLLDEDYPVIAQMSARDEKYTIEIVIFVKFEDTHANARLIHTLTETMRAALRADITPPNRPLGGYCYSGELGDSRVIHGSKGDVLLRISITKIEYIKRIII